MNLTETLMNAGNGSVVDQIAKKLGLSTEDAQKAVQGLAPAVSQGFRKNTNRSGGLENLLSAVKSGRHQQYLDNPETLTKPETVEDGNAILGHIFGSKDVSRNVAGEAAQRTGIDPSILKQILPMVAAAAMGSVSKQASQGGDGLLGQLSGAFGGDGSNPLESFLDADKDGSVADDLLSMAKKFF